MDWHNNYWQFQMQKYNTTINNICVLLLDVANKYSNCGPFYTNRSLKMKPTLHIKIKPIHPLLFLISNIFNLYSKCRHLSSLLSVPLIFFLKNLLKYVYVWSDLFHNFMFIPKLPSFHHVRTTERQQSWDQRLTGNLLHRSIFNWVLIYFFFLICTCTSGNTWPIYMNTDFIKTVRGVQMDRFVWILTKLRNFGLFDSIFWFKKFSLVDNFN